MQNVCQDLMSSCYAGEIALGSHKRARARFPVVGNRTMVSCASYRVLRALARETELLQCDRVQHVGFVYLCE